MNDIAKVSHLFKFNNYADDSTLFSTLQTFGNPIDEMINHELHKVSYWLKVNKLSLNIEKTKYMIFAPHNKSINDINIQVDGKKIDRVKIFLLPVKYMCIYGCVYVHTCMYMYIYVYLYVYGCMCVNVCLYMCIIMYFIY